MNLITAHAVFSSPGMYRNCGSRGTGETASPGGRGEGRHLRSPRLLFVAREIRGLTHKVMDQMKMRSGQQNRAHFSYLDVLLLPMTFSSS